jgi:hypothetical protein
MNNKFPKEKFNLRESKGDDYYKIVMVNASLKGYQYKQEFPWLLSFDIELKESTPPFFLPNRREAKVLNTLEDKFTSVIKSVVPYHFIGRTTDQGHRKLFFYVQSPEELHNRLKELVVSSENSIREWEYTVREDPNWDNVDFFFDY